MRVLGAAISPASVLELARTDAEAIDSKVEGINAGLAAAIETSGRGRIPRRSLHRRHHLDHIERALAR